MDTLTMETFISDEYEKILTNPANIILWESRSNSTKKDGEPVLICHKIFYRPSEKSTNAILCTYAKIVISKLHTNDDSYKLLRTVPEFISFLVHPPVATPRSYPLWDEVLAGLRVSVCDVLKGVMVIDVPAAQPLSPKAETEVKKDYLCDSCNVATKKTHNFEGLELCEDCSDKMLVIKPFPTPFSCLNLPP